MRSTCSFPRSCRQPISCPANLLSSIDERPAYLLSSKSSESPGALWGPEPLLTCLVWLSQWQEGCLFPVPAGAAPQAGLCEHGLAEKQGTGVWLKVLCPSGRPCCVQHWSTSLWVDCLDICLLQSARLSTGTKTESQPCQASLFLSITILSTLLL